MPVKGKTPRGTFVQPVTLTTENGSYIDLGPSSASVDAFSVYNSSVFESGSVIAGTATLYGVRGYHSGAASFAQIHNSTGSLENTDVPEIIIALDANSNFTFDTGRFGIPFTAGITTAESSTPATLTSGSEATWYNVIYK